jgi:hypothetical protein
MASLTNNKIKDTYQSLVKFNDNGNITTSAKRLTDGFGNNSPFFVSTTQIGIGVTPTLGYDLHVNSNTKIGGNLEVGGNLTVSGTLTYIDVEDLATEDPLIKLARNNTDNLLDIGFYGKYVESTVTKYKGLYNDADDDKWKLFIGTSDEPTTVVNTGGTGYTVGTLVANIEGATGTFSGLLKSDTLELTSGADHLTITESSGDWTINNAQQNNGITIYDGTGGIDLKYAGSSYFEVDTTGVHTTSNIDFYVDTNTLYVDAANNLVGIGKNPITYKLDVNGKIASNNYIIAGLGNGGVALTHNDGQGNANVTFNHVSGIPEQNGNSFRIIANTDSSTNAYMGFEIKEGVTADTAVSTIEVFRLDTDGPKVRQAGGGNISLQRDDTSIVDGNPLGRIRFSGDDPTNDVFNRGVEIRAEAAGTWSTDNYPSELQFYTTATNTDELALTLDSSQNATFTNNVDVDGNLQVDGTIKDSDGDAGTSGQLLSSTGTGTNWIDFEADVAKRIDVTVKNVSGGSLAKGVVVHAAPTATPPSGNVIEVIAADANDAAKMPAIGVLNETIADEAEGEAVMFGAVSGIDTSSFSIGDELYVSTTAGEFTATKPTANDELVQKVAIVIKSHASNGLIKVFGAGRANDVPNRIDRNVNFTDSSLLSFGNGVDFYQYHDGTNSYIKNYTGDLTIEQNADDKDIIFKSDNGSGGTVEYFRIDGSTNTIPFGRSPHIVDNLKLYFGNDTTNDASIKWDSTASELFIDGESKFLEKLTANNNFEAKGTVDLNVMPTHESEGSIQIGRYDGNTSRYHLIKNYVSSTQASNYIKFSLHNGTGNTTTDVLSLYGNGNINVLGEVTATEYNLPSSGMLDWANGDARIVEGLVNNYSLSFQTWDGSAVSTALRLDGNNTATFAGEVLIASGEYLSWGTSGTTAIEGSTVSNKLAFFTQSTERMRIDSSGNVGIGDSTPSYRLDLVTGSVDTQQYSMRISHTRNDPDQGSSGLFIDANYSGTKSDATDIVQRGLHIDVDSSATGTATDEHRIYGIHSDTRNSGFADQVYGTYSFAESNYTGAKTAALAGIYGIATHDSSSANGGVSSMYGARGVAQIQDNGDVDNAYGVHGYVSIANNRLANVDATHGLYGEVQIDEASALTYGSMYGCRTVIDNNEGSVPTFGSQFLFHGDYQGTRGSNAWGIYCDGNKNYLEGNTGIGTTTPYKKLEVAGDLQLDASNANMWIKSGVAGTNGFINWTFNTDDTVFIKTGIDYDTRATLGYHIDSGYPITIDCTNYIDFKRSAGVLGRWNSTGLGIGTTSPVGNCEISDSTQATGATLSITNAHSGSWASGDKIGSIDFRIDDASTTEFVRARIHSEGLTTGTYPSSSQLVFSTANANTLSERMRIDSSGDLIIKGGRIYLKESDLGNTAIALTRDADEGYVQLFSSGSQTIEIRGNGNSYFNGGAVGIGTTSPTARLDILTNSATGDNNIDRHVRFRADNGEQRFNFFVGRSGNSANLSIYNSSEVIGAFISSDNDSYFNGGDVGIGTTSPDAKLDVQSNHSQLRLTDSDDSKYALFSYSSSFLSIRNNSTNAEHFALDSSGYVGIGTNSPDNILHIRNGDTTYASQVGADTMLFLETTNISNALQFTSANTGQQYIMFGDDDPNAGWISYNHSDNNLNFRVNGTEKLRIDNAGNIIIAGQTVNHIKTDTSDGSDNKGMVINSAGGPGTSSRGAYISMYGNEHASTAGDMYITAGNTSGAELRLHAVHSGGTVTTYAGGSLRHTVTSTLTTINNYTQVNNTIATENTMGTAGEWNAARIRVEATNTVNNTGFTGIRFATSTADNYGWSMGANRVSSGLGDFRIYEHQGASTGFHRITIQKTTGYLGVKDSTPSYHIDVNGTIRATGDVIAYSDRRVKDNIETIENGLEKVTKLRGVSYTRNDIEDDTTKIGVIAQEVLEVLPEVVKQDDRGKYSVSYGNMAGLFIEAIKDLKTEINQLKEEIKELKSK